MMNKILILLLAAFTSGCFTQVPIDLQYSSPQAGVPVATIRGSENKCVLLDNFTAFIAGIDGKLVMARRKGWNTPITIEAGHHILDVKFNRGVFVADTSFDFDAVADTNYQLKFTTDERLFGKNSYVDFWIVDMATSKTVSPIKEATVDGSRDDGGFFPLIFPAR